MLPCRDVVNLFIFNYWLVALKLMRDKLIGLIVVNARIKGWTLMIIYSGANSKGLIKNKSGAIFKGQRHYHI